MIRRLMGCGMCMVLAAGLSFGSGVGAASAEPPTPPPGSSLMDLIRATPAIPVKSRTTQARPYTPPASNILIILATIRSLESGGNYRAQNPTSTASGAYQFSDPTWGGYGGYAHAADAPPAVQDAKATDSVMWILKTNASDVGAVPVVWFIGHVPAAGSPEWDVVPGTNRLTPRQYQTLWLQRYHALGGS